MTPSTLGSANASTMSLSLKTKPEAVIDAIWRLSAAFAGGAAMLLKQPTPKSAGATALPSAFQGFLSACGCSDDAVDAASRTVRQRIVGPLALSSVALRAPAELAQQRATLAS